MTLRSTALFIASLIFSASLSAAMYKWVDENGKTHYSQFPPPDREHQTMVPPPPPASDAGEAQQRLEELLKRQDAQRQGRSEAEQEDQQAAEEVALRKRNCKTARENLQKLTTGGRKRIIGADGEAYYMTEEKRQSKIAEARKQIEEHCD